MLTGNGLHNTSCNTGKMDTPSSFIGKMEIIQIRYDSAAAKESTYVLFKKRPGSISIRRCLGYACLPEKRGMSAGSFSETAASNDKSSLKKACQLRSQALSL